MKNPLQIDHINLTVKSIAETERWYGAVFGFEKVGQGVRSGRPWAILRKDDLMLAVYESPHRTFVDSDGLADQKIHGVSHFGLRVDDTRWWEHQIQKHHIAVDHTFRYPHSTSWYVTDPTGYEIEVSCWDNGKVVI